MTQTLEKAFQEAAKLPVAEQDILATFILDHWALLAALNEGIEAADQGKVGPLEEVEKMISRWISK